MTALDPALTIAVRAGPADRGPVLPSAAPTWWIRPGLESRAGRLTIAGRDAEALARESGTPLFVYDLERVAENAGAVVAALGRSGVHHRVRFALKANHQPEVLAVLRGLGAAGSARAIGIDACSPGEVEHAVAHGWSADEISFTGTNLSERDLDVLLPSGVHLNLDAISQIERVGRRAPGRRIGIRINPGAGAGYHDGLTYSGGRATKFGIYADRLDAAVEAARRHDLTIDTLHFHAGSGWLADGLPAFAAAFGAALRMLDRLIELGCPIDEVNVGGGLGAPARTDERPIDLDAYAALMARELGPRGVAVAVEPGDYIVKDAAILLGEIVTVEDRAGIRFVGLDLGWNVDCSYFIYRFAQEAVICRAADAERTQSVTIAGHINEAGDIFAEAYPLPEVHEGDIVALLNAGGYKQAMSSTHCLRPMAPARFLER
jgi:diaminopimelate decarboxylase